jgi:hypothetical protein
MNGPVEIGDLSPRRYFAAVAVVLGLLFAFIGGDAQSDAGLALRLFQWQLQSCLPMALLLFAHLLWSRSRWFECRGPWTQLLLSGISGSLLFTPVALMLDAWLLGEGRDALRWCGLADEFLALGPPVTLAWIAVNAPFVLGLRLRLHPEQDSLADSTMVGAEHETPLPAFMQLVPKSARGPILYLQAELHYLAVVTERGRSLILYNLRDAADELAKVAGLQTHRSFWVALDRVDRFQRRGRQGVLIMQNGDEIPVSRRRIAAVTAALG